MFTRVYMLSNLMTGIAVEDPEKSWWNSSRGGGVEREVPSDGSQPVSWRSRRFCGRRWRTTTEPNSRSWQEATASLWWFPAGTVRKADRRSWRLLRRQIREFWTAVQLLNCLCYWLWLVWLRTSAMMNDVNHVDSNTCRRLLYHFWRETRIYVIWE